MSADDRGRDTSPELTEARTVLSRAETALMQLEGMQRARANGDGWYGPEDPDHWAIADALKATVTALWPYRRTGRTRK